MATETESKTGTRFTEPIGPGHVDMESGLDATEVLKRLEDAGHDHAPDKQRVRLELAGQKVTLYRAADGRAVLLNAEQTDYYLDKGGAFCAKKPSSAEIRKYRREHGLEDVHLPGVDNDEQPGDQTDPPDKFSEPRTKATRAAKAAATPPDVQKVQLTGDTNTGNGGSSVAPPAPTHTGVSGVTTSADLAGKK